MAGGDAPFVQSKAFAESPGPGGKEGLLAGDPEGKLGDVVEKKTSRDLLQNA
eukprot:CAMPEP_0181265228 /NCGR_PEP_ID=MMETSP1097-20121128/3600_1 /TAXON_ID=35684 /ORGANISM="Pseudopedinella elastica, Strain CCMP716" /LENGTH=51 /DNA_ID=CAMNT_0023364265 /DNA_START=241 /DNA_END=393 /DNA_ORIENTATION=-